MAGSVFLYCVDKIVQLSASLQFARRGYGIRPWSFREPHHNLWVGSDTWIRTRDPLINSQLLYR